MREPAAAEFLKAATTGMDQTGWLYCLGHVYAISGQTAQARITLDRLVKLSEERHVDAYYPAVIHIGLGETDQAFRWFEKAFQDRSEELLFLKLDPRLDGIRADPRYQSLVRRIGLPP